jgi:hypothetical protein
MMSGVMKMRRLRSLLRPRYLRHRGRLLRDLQELRRRRLARRRNDPLQRLRLHRRQLRFQLRLRLDLAVHSLSLIPLLMTSMMIAGLPFQVLGRLSLYRSQRSLRLKMRLPRLL